MPLALGLVVAGGALYWRLGNGEVAHDGAPAWSPDGRQIVFSVEQSGHTDLYLMNADGSGRRRLTTTPFDEGAPSFSADGRTIAFESNQDGNADIFVMGLDGRPARKLTTDRAEDRAPAFSRDGRRLVFLSTRGRTRESDVYTMNVDGSNVRRWTSSGQHWSPQFSSAGLAIAVQTDRDIEVIDLETGAARRLTYDPQNGMSPAWAPDGVRMVFTSTRNARLELFTMDYDGSNQRPLLSMPGGSALDPKWSPDGTRVAFVYVPQVSSRSSGDQPYAIYVLELDSQKVTRLSP